MLGKKADLQISHGKVDCLLHPVTTLAFVPLQDSRPLLFVGEGPFLHIYSHDRLNCLASQRIFDSQSVHGITYLTAFSGPYGKESNTLVFLYGGSSICFLVIDHLTPKTQPGFQIKFISSTIQTDDWILDASFKPIADDSENVQRDFFHVLLVNSHNCLQYLRIQALSYPESKYDWHLCHFIEGPKLILYSAHISWSSIGRGLVAAGTVLGEVLLWSFDSDDIISNSKYPYFYLVHYTFYGHEGSVFGVRISDERTDSLSIPAGRYLASCSDDRTIRVWDISSVDDESATDMFDQSTGDITLPHRSHKVSSLPVATTMGHTSRIWGLRFLHHTTEDSLLLSFGEDATSQIWRFRPQSDAVGSGQVGQAWDHHLQHECTFEFHVKRNIWSATAYRDVDGHYVISTGGADGRIVCFSLNDDRGHSLAGTSRTAEWTVTSVLDKLKYDDEKSSFKGTIAAKADVNIMPENVFKSLKGHWNVYRRLESEMSTYQSGKFIGTASFEMRSPTDPAYDAEYLYIENGDFHSEQGLIIPATRRYIYRFQRNAKIISAWFVKAEDGLAVDYLFHNIDFTSCEQEYFSGTNGRSRLLLEANGHHLCINDNYLADYLFRFQGMICDYWDLKYSVKGPRKAYSTTTQYVRDDSHHTAKNDSMSENAIRTMSNSGDRSETGHDTAVPDMGTFSTYTWVGDDQLLALTTKGYLLLGNISYPRTQEDKTAKNQIKPEGLWAKVDYLADLETFCLVRSIQHPAITLFVGRTRSMYFYEHHKLIKSQIRLPGKPTYLKSHVINHRKNEVFDQNLRKVKLLIIASCPRSLIGCALYVDVDLEISSYSLSSSFAIYLQRPFIVTSSCFSNTKNMLFLGSRNGALAIYEHTAISTDHNNLRRSFVSHGINGRDAITVIENLPLRSSTFDTGAYILTAGRDGTYSIHLVTTERPRDQATSSMGFQTVHTCKLPFGPNIEGACFNRTTEELWLWGFASKDFVVWNESCKTKVMTVECGGAHRNWAFSPGDDGDAGGQFAWTKASSCRVYSQPRASHQVLKQGGHGREIKTAAVSPPIKLLDGQVAKLVATGAEDTAIRIFLAPSRMGDGAQLAPQGLQCLGVFTKHTSGLQQLRWSPNGKLLFSAAGCEEFFVWCVRPAPCVKIGLVCEAICPSVTEAADLRIMSFDVMKVGSDDDETNGVGLPIHRYLLTMVYSDSTMRVRILVIPSYFNCNQS